jgi:hypothetical protein
MDIVFVDDYPSVLKLVLIVEHLHQIVPVDVFANIAGDYAFPGPVHSGGRHVEGEAEQLRLRLRMMNDAKSTYSSVSALLMYSQTSGKVSEKPLSPGKLKYRYHTSIVK